MKETLESEFRHPKTSLEREIAGLGPWFHNLHLPGGVQTAPDHPLGDFPSFKWMQIAPHLPDDLHGWSALDIGCNAGFYSFELARRGADVTALDIDAHYLRQAKWAASKVGLRDRVAFQQRQVYDLARSAETYDLVWFMGVFYHLRYPLLALDTIARVTRRLLVFQALTVSGEEAIVPPENLTLNEREKLDAAGWPKMAFIEHRLAGDPTNWWVPNHACIEAMLRSSGFRIVARPGHELYLCEPIPRREETDLSKLLNDEYTAAAGLSPAPILPFPPLDGNKNGH